MLIQIEETEWKEGDFDIVLKVFVCNQLRQF